MTLLEFTSQFFDNFKLETCQELERMENIKGQLKFKKRLKMLLLYIENKYMGDSDFSESEFDLKFQEALSENKINEEAFKNFVKEKCYKPFKECAAKQFEEIVGQLEKVHAINKKDLLEKIGAAGNEKAFQFVVKSFDLEEINYSSRSIKDLDFEVLYSNDHISLNTPQAKTIVNTFFDFFIYGDAEKNNNVYNPEKYYGCIPVQENRIIAYCKKESIPQEYIDKLLAIAKCSNRFNITEKGELSLKKQYLNNNEAYAVAILYENGRPLHKDEVWERINKLHRQYPDLIKEREASLNLRKERKPIIYSSGGQGEWGLEIWRKDKRNVQAVIREFVADIYAKTKEPVHIDQIVDYVHSIGFSYNKKSIKTYVTKSGCKGTGINTYYPADSEYTAVDKYWTKKTHIIQRDSAEYLLEKGPAKREDIVNYIAEKRGHYLNKPTFNNALFKYSDLFLKEGNSTAQLIKLSDKIVSKSAIKKAFPEPSKQEPEYISSIRKEIIEYLKNSKECVFQKDLVALFEDKMPNHLKHKDSRIRDILDDKSIFVKTELGEKKTQVTLDPLYLERLRLEGLVKPSVAVLPAEEQSFSWDGLKKGLLRQMAQKEYDNNLSDYVDNMFYIIRGGNEELLPNSNFKLLIPQLYKYVTAPTSLEERQSLQKEMLSMMEAYCKEFYRLQNGDLLQDQRGLGQVVLYLQEKGVIPDRNRGYLEKPELNISFAVERVRNQRNNLVGHPEAFAEQKDKQSISDIHDCLLVMMYLAEKLTKH